MIREGGKWMRQDLREGGELAGFGWLAGYVENAATENSCKIGDRSL